MQQQQDGGQHTSANMCFLENKFIVTPCKTLKTAVLQYSAEELADANVRLVNDIKSLNLDKQPPHTGYRYGEAEIVAWPMKLTIC